MSVKWRSPLKASCQFCHCPPFLNKSKSSLVLWPIFYCKSTSLEEKVHANHRNPKKTTTFVFNKRSVTYLRKCPISQHLVSDSGHSTKGLKRGGTTRICAALVKVDTEGWKKIEWVLFVVEFRSLGLEVHCAREVDTKRLFRYTLFLKVDGWIDKSGTY